jgi:hypothetical protein
VKILATPDEQPKGMAHDWNRVSITVGLTAYFVGIGVFEKSLLG